MNPRTPVSTTLLLSEYDALKAAAARAHKRPAALIRDLILAYLEQNPAEDTDDTDLAEFLG